MRNLKLCLSLGYPLITSTQNASISLDLIVKDVGLYINLFLNQIRMVV